MNHRRFWEDAQGVLHAPDKVAGARKDYTLHFVDWLADDTITGCTVTARGVTVDSFRQVGDTAVEAWLSGGKRGYDAEIQFDIETAAGRKETIIAHMKIE